MLSACRAGSRAPRHGRQEHARTTQSLKRRRRRARPLAAAASGPAKHRGFLQAIRQSCMQHPMGIGPCQQWGRDNDQQQMLRHMGGEQTVAESVERRQQRQGRNTKPAEECTVFEENCRAPGPAAMVDRGHRDTRPAAPAARSPLWGLVKPSCPSGHRSDRSRKDTAQGDSRSGTRSRKIAPAVKMAPATMPQSPGTAYGRCRRSWHGFHRRLLVTRQPPGAARCPEAEHADENADDAIWRWSPGGRAAVRQLSPISTYETSSCTDQAIGAANSPSRTIHGAALRRWGAGC